MNEAKKLKVGDVLYWYGSNTGRLADARLQESKVTEVGKKYAKAGGHTIEISTMRNKSDYQTYDFYTDKQVVLDIIEYRDLHRYIGKEFGSYDYSKYTLSQLRRINEILNE